MKKFDALRRSQIYSRIYAVEKLLPGLKYGSDKDRRLRAERAELLEALQKKDAELIDKWNKSGYPAIT